MSNPQELRDLQGSSSLPMPERDELQKAAVEPPSALEMGLLKEENEFLRAHVQRVETQLRIYQERYPELQPTRPTEDIALERVMDEHLPPWVSNSKYVSPLLVAYEARIEELELKNEECKKQLEIFREEADKVVQLNQSLESELEHNIRKLMRKMEPGASGSRQPMGVTLDEDTELEIREFEKRLELSRSQIELMRNQLEELQASYTEKEQELYDCHEEKNALSQTLTKFNNARAALQSQANKIADERDTLLKQRAEMQALLLSKSTRIQQLEHTVDSLTAELKLQNNAVHQFKQQLEEANNQMALDSGTLGEELARFRQRELEMTSKLEHLEKALNDNERAMNESKARLTDATTTNDALLGAVDSLKQTIEAGRHAEAKLRAQMNELAEQEQAALFKQKQAEVQAEGLSKELETLQARVAEIKAQSAKEKESAIAKLFSERKSHEQQLQNQVQDLEMACSQLQVHHDEKVRQAQLATATLERVSKALKEEQARLHDELNQVKAEAAEMKHERDISEEKAARTEAKWTRFEQDMKDECLQMKNHIERLRSDLNAAQSRGRQLQHKLDATETKLADAKDALDEERELSAQRVKELREELDLVTETKQEENTDLRNRLDQAYRLQEDAQAKAKELLVAQEELTVKLRREAQDVGARFNREVSDLKAENARLSSRSIELDTELQHCLREREDLLNYQRQTEITKTKLQLELTDCQERLESALTQLNQKRNEVSEYMTLTRDLQSEIDSLELEKRKLDRQIASSKRRLAYQQQQKQLLHNTTAHNIPASVSVPSHEPKPQSPHASS